MAYASKYREQLDNSLKRLTDFQPTNYEVQRPTYTSRYADTVDRLLRETTDPQPFTYDQRQDPVMDAYRKEYLREGRRATQDAIGRSAAVNGGALSTAGVAAAAQAGHYYAAKLADKVPELYQDAYGRYLDGYNQKLQALEAARGQEQTEYGRFRDQLQDDLDERNFRYKQDADQYNRLLDQISAIRAADATEYDRSVDERQWQHGLDREAIEDTRYADETAYTRRLNEQKLRSEQTNSGSKTETTELGYPSVYSKAVTNAGKKAASGDSVGAADDLYWVIANSSASVRDTLTEEQGRAMCASSGVDYKLLTYCLNHGVAPSEALTGTF